MFDIKGRAATAKCFAKVVENEAISQIQRMCDYDLSEGSIIRIMPDVHAGKGCTIGTTMTITDKVVPNIVGVDIGCGMYTVNIGKGPIDFKVVDEAAHHVPSGFNTWDEVQEYFDLKALRCYDDLRNKTHIEKSLGTLGGGNHFIEIDQSKNGEYFLIIHSGSRNLGKQVAEIYQQLAIELAHGKEDFLKQRDEIIRTYKAEGRQKDIQKALKALKEQERVASIPDDLAYVYGTYMEDYLHDVDICQKFAKRSREIMADTIMTRAGLEGKDGFHTIHNYIDVDEMILRKGAIAAHKGEKVLIPINMKDGSIIAIGRGNPDWNYSAPHGAGRIMSRMAARSLLDMDEYREMMKDVYTTSVNLSTIDEAPMAYKSLEDIVDVIADSVDIIDIMKPVYNFKASD